jgi:hypothetical protein
MQEYSERYQNYLKQGNEKSFLPSIYAWVDLLEKYQRKNMVVCEIGTSDGSTTRSYLEIIRKNDGHLFAIDWFNGNLGVNSGTHFYNPSNSDGIYELFKKNVHSYLDIVEIKKGKSSQMISSISDKSIDFCFIDASHLYHDVYEDIKLILPKMKEGGILAGHDCEDISLANKGREEWLYRDFVGVPDPNMPNEHPYYGLRWVHYGVIQAVYDHFGNNIESFPDPDGQGVNIWVKYL